MDYDGEMASLMIQGQPSVVIVTWCLQDHALQINFTFTLRNMDVTENSSLYGNVLTNVNLESVFVIQAAFLWWQIGFFTRFRFLYWAHSVLKTPASSSTLCPWVEYLLALKLCICSYLEILPSDDVLFVNIGEKEGQRLRQVIYMDDSPKIVSTKPKGFLNFLIFSQIKTIEFQDETKFFILRQNLHQTCFIDFEKSKMWNGAWTKLQLKVCQVVHASLAYLDKHSILDPVMFSIVSSIPTGGNFFDKIFQTSWCKLMRSYREKTRIPRHICLCLDCHFQYERQNVLCFAFTYPFPVPVL